MNVIYSVDSSGTLDFGSGTKETVYHGGRVDWMLVLVQKRQQCQKKKVIPTLSQP